MNYTLHLVDSTYCSRYVQYTSPVFKSSIIPHQYTSQWN